MARGLQMRYVTPLMIRCTHTHTYTLSTYAITCTHPPTQAPAKHQKYVAHVLGVPAHKIVSKVRVHTQALAWWHTHGHGGERGRWLPGSAPPPALVS